MTQWATNEVSGGRSAVMGRAHFPPPKRASSGIGKGRRKPRSAPCPRAQLVRARGPEPRFESGYRKGKAPSPEDTALTKIFVVLKRGLRRGEGNEPFRSRPELALGLPASVRRRPVRPERERVVTKEYRLSQPTCPFPRLRTCRRLGPGLGPRPQPPPTGGAPTGLARRTEACRRPSSK